MRSTTSWDSCYGKNCDPNEPRLRAIYPLEHVSGVGMPVLSQSDG